MSCWIMLEYEPDIDKYQWQGWLTDDQNSIEWIREQGEGKAPELKNYRYIHIPTINSPVSMFGDVTLLYRGDIKINYDQIADYNSQSYYEYTGIDRPVEILCENCQEKFSEFKVTINSIALNDQQTHESYILLCSKCNSFLRQRDWLNLIDPLFQEVNQ